MKFEIKRLPINASIEEIKSEIRRVAELIPDAVISRTKFEELSKISISTLNKKFGSWENVLRSCELEHRYSGRSVSRKMKNQIAKNLSDAELIAELKRVSKQIGKLELTHKEFNQNSEISASSIVRRFGTWSKGLEAAGIGTVKIGKRYTEFDLFDNLVTVWTHWGRQPSMSEMKQEPSIIGTKAYVIRWGSWTKALNVFVEKANSDIPISEVVQKRDLEEVIVRKTVAKKSLPEDRREIPWGLRFRIYKRDNYKCVICGRSPATTFGITLHIDHIEPFSKEGKTREDNLRTLCNECNIGKGDKDD
jgi:hypothetical protein